MRVVVFTVVVIITIAVAYVVGVNAGKLFSQKRRAEVHRSIVEKMDDMKIGDKLPDWTFENLTFQPERLSDHLYGKTLLIFVQPNCPGCLEDIERLSSIVTDSLLSRKVVFISGDNPRELMDLRDDFKLQSTILYDHERAYSWQLGVSTFPFHIVVGPDLVIERIIPATLIAEEIEEIFSD